MIHKLSKTDRLSMAMDAVRRGMTLKAAAKRFGLHRESVRSAARRRGIAYDKKAMKPNYATAADGVPAKKSLVVEWFARLCDSADTMLSGHPTGEVFSAATAALGQSTRNLRDDHWGDLYRCIKRSHKAINKKFAKHLSDLRIENAVNLSHLALAALEMNGAISDGSVAEREIWGDATRQFREAALALKKERSSGQESNRRGDAGSDFGASLDWQDEEGDC